MTKKEWKIQKKEERQKELEKRYEEQDKKREEVAKWDIYVRVGISPPLLDCRSHFSIQLCVKDKNPPYEWHMYDIKNVSKETPYCFKDSTEQQRQIFAKEVDNLVKEAQLLADMLKIPLEDQTKYIIACA